MNRAKQRQLNRTATCPLCFRPMTQHDRIRYTRPSLNKDLAVRAWAHPKCVAALATKRARAAEAAVANMAAAAEAIETAQRTQAIGLWVPSQGAL